MSASTRERRSILPAAAIGALLLVALLAPVTHGADPRLSSNRLEQPIIDLAVLPAHDPAATPRVLVLDASPPSPTAVRIEVLERADGWAAVATVDIDVGARGLDARWLVALAPTRFALIATTPERSLTDDRPERTVVIGIEVAPAGDRAALAEIGRRRFDRSIGDAGAPDTDGDGSAELLLHLRPDPAEGGPCRTSDLAVLDAATFATIRDLTLPWSSLAAGVIGRWDSANGDDLLAYTADCEAGADPGTHLAAVRLLDGAPIHDVDLGLTPDELQSLGPPLRLDLDGVAPDEAVALTGLGVAIVDPASAWAETRIGSASAIPLVAGPDASASDRMQRVALIEPWEGGLIATGRFRRGSGSAIVGDGSSVLDWSAMPAARWGLISAAARHTAARHDPAAAWIGDTLVPGCPDLVVPAGILLCGDKGLRAGAAWLATRPIAVMPIERQRRLLVGAGVEWDPEAGLPAVPTPWAAAPPGWWRHGPSVAFVVSEVRVDDLAYFRDFPVPRASIDRTTSADATTTLPGFTGARFFVVASALADGEELGVEAERTQSAHRALAGAGHGALDGTDGDRDASHVVRVPVPPGLESGRDGSFVRLSLADVTLADGTAAGRWGLRVVPINDWGEAGAPAVGVVSRDTKGPSVSVDVPFLSPIWPVPARLVGGTEPGSTVEVEGVAGPFELDRRGRFAIDTTLAPWPQTLRVSATDEEGNRTVSEISVIGGIDYRRLPWALLAALALLLVVTIRSLGTGPARAVVGAVGGARWSTAGVDDGPVPEIEELPPGAGLPRR
ncbi:MAG: hypothetical protein ACXW4T_00450 [Candidatus Limnocylindrales bacterium]